MKVVLFHRRPDEYHHLVRERIPELEVALGMITERLHMDENAVHLERQVNR